ncbi:hypothetical protein [Paenibacillus sp. FSL R7-0337]|uniref:hypothetical protein n=1 Tax=Paenibacillus sp. FSL R7-0337 TaxID=1926588 RepID=UPI00096C1898|nr:hypothetical protein [Paenibacillus sp. FSL R7-0337]OMF88727.1 hypothetical protein BK147_26330 [Paenibacillus sp. FSL R7-0337]
MHIEGRRIPQIVIADVRIGDELEILKEYYFSSEEMYSDFFNEHNEILKENLNKLELSASYDFEDKVKLMRTLALRTHRNSFYVSCLSKYEMLLKEICLIIIQERELKNVKIKNREFTLRRGFQLIKTHIDANILEEIEEYSILENFVELRNCIVHRDARLDHDEMKLYLSDNINDEFLLFLKNYEHVSLILNRVEIHPICIRELINTLSCFFQVLCKKIRIQLHDPYHYKMLEIIKQFKSVN